MTNDDIKGDLLYAVLEHYDWDLNGQRSGWYSIKCGAHDDSRASCRVNFDIGQLTCLACDIKGDAYNIIQHYEGCDFRDALKLAEEIFGGGNRQLPTASGRGSRVPQDKRSHVPSRRYTPPRVRRTGTG